MVKKKLILTSFLNWTNPFLVVCPLTLLSCCGVADLSLKDPDVLRGHQQHPKSSLVMSKKLASAAALEQRLNALEQQEWASESEEELVSDADNEDDGSVEPLHLFGERSQSLS